MIIIVSMSQFRQHIADYITKAKDGHTVILQDKKRGEQIAQLVAKKKFNPATFGKALRQATGIYTAENHPEWRTKRDVVKWVEKERSIADRNF